MAVAEMIVTFLERQRLPGDAALCGLGGTVEAAPKRVVRCRGHVECSAPHYGSSSVVRQAWLTEAAGASMRRREDPMGRSVSVVRSRPQGSGQTRVAMKEINASAET